MIGAVGKLVIALHQPRSGGMILGGGVSPRTPGAKDMSRASGDTFGAGNVAALRLAFPPTQYGG